MVKKQVSAILLNFENEMWQRGIWGTIPQTMRFIVLFPLGINVWLRVGDELA